MADGIGSSAWSVSITQRYEIELHFPECQSRGEGIIAQIHVKSTIGWHRRLGPPLAIAEESRLARANREVTFARRYLARAAMAQSAPPPFDPYRPPVIEGFTPTSHRGEAERFQSKFMRKFRQNPFVPLGEPGRIFPLVE